MAGDEKEMAEVKKIFFKKTHMGLTPVFQLDDGRMVETRWSPTGS